MDAAARAGQAEVREFLITRRAKLSPDEVGVIGGGNRRVPGLRRGEVAQLAGVSVEYYAKLERGNLSGASDAVLEAVASALRLDDAERSHLFDLARSATTPRAHRARPRTARSVPDHLQVMLEAVTAGPAFVTNGRSDLLAANRLATAFYEPVYRRGGSTPNFARFQFLERDASEAFYPDWASIADMTVANLRTEAGRDPHSKELHDLVGELSTRSEDFRRRWAAHDVRRHSTGVKAFRHPLVGDLRMRYHVAELVGEPGLALTVYTAEPESPSEAALRLLASWRASETAPAAEHEVAQ